MTVRAARGRHLPDGVGRPGVQRVARPGDVAVRADLGQRTHPGRSAASADITTTAAALSFFRRNWRPHGTVLGQVPEMGGWYGTAKYPGATQLPGVVVFRREAPLFFANSGQFRDKVRRLARERPLPGSFCTARWSLTSMSLPPKLDEELK